MNARALIWPLAAGIVALVATGCPTTSVSRRTEVIDLNRVLEIFDRVSQESVPGKLSTGAEDEKLKPVEEVDPKVQQWFLTRFAEELNEANLISAHIGVSMRANGSIQGFEDHNKNMERGFGEDQLFIIEIDADRRRIIGTQVIQNHTYRRDRYYGSHHYSRRHYGYWGYGGMWGRQRRYYRTHDERRPSYSTMTMSPTNYHDEATRRARGRTGRSRTGRRGRSTRGRTSRGARSRGGSRSYGRGK